MEKILFVFIMLFSVFVQSVAGFGGTMLAMPIGIMLMGIGLAKPVLTFVAWITGMVVFITEYKNVNWRELIKMVSVMLIGVLGGIWVSGNLKIDFLLIIYGVVVAGIGFKKLFFPTTKTLSPTWQNISLGIAGIMQGLFVSGGSFLAVYSMAKIPEKQAFHATVNAVWSILNTVMIITFFIDGLVTQEVAVMGGIIIVPTLVTVWLGNLLTKHIPQKIFLKIIYVILIVSGVVLLITNL